MYGEKKLTAQMNYNPEVHPFPRGCTLLYSLFLLNLTMYFKWKRVWNTYEFINIRACDKIIYRPHSAK